MVYWINKFEKLHRYRFLITFLSSVTGDSWNCIVGKNFGSHVVHMTKSYLFCTYGEEISILLWKSG